MGIRESLSIIQSTVIGRVIEEPTEGEVQQALDEDVKAFELSPQDKSCLVKIQGDGGFIPNFFDIPISFPTLWTYPRRLVPVRYDLLDDSPSRNSIPTLRGTATENLSEMETDQRHFWNMLIAVMSKIHPQCPTKPDVNHPLLRKTYVLDVGCGRGWDAMPLHSFFGQSPYGVPGRNVEYLGIDIDPFEIKVAKEEHETRPDLKFEVASATRFDEYPFLVGSKFDVVVIRHPVVFERDSFSHINPMWYKIFKEVFEHLAPGGILIVTAYNLREHKGAEEALSCVGAKQVFFGKNPFSANITLYLRNHDWRDAYVSVYTLNE